MADVVTVPDRRRLAELRQLFVSVDYRVDSVVEALGESAHAALGRNQTTPGLRALADRDDPLASLIKLWPLQTSLTRAEANRALPDLVEMLIDAEVLVRDGDDVRALVDCRPYAFEDGTGGAGGDGIADGGAGQVDAWVFSDLTPGLDGRRVDVAPDWVLGVSPASTSLAQLTVRTPVRRALDLGTGCGVQSLHLVRHADEVVATDLNARALIMAKLTTMINETDVDIRGGDLYGPVGHLDFDLITTNPPYVMAPPGDDHDRLSYREAGLLGDELVRRVVVEGASRLAPGGALQVLGNWAQRAGEDWTERPRRWIEQTGCDAHVVRREDLDAAEYVEIWLADAGLLGTPDYVRRYRQWLDYFEGLDIASVGMGWLTLVNAGRDDPDVTLEHWPYPIEQPIGPASAARIVAVHRDHTLDDDAVLATRWTLADDVISESTARPGSADPYAVVFRQQRGFRRAEQVDTALAGVLGACDGELSLSRIIAAVASIMEVEENTLAAEIVPRVRHMSLQGLLWP